MHSLGKFGATSITYQNCNESYVCFRKEVLFASVQYLWASYEELKFFSSKRSQYLSAVTNGSSMF